MIKNLILILSLLLLTGCTMYRIDNLLPEDIINRNIVSVNELYNVNNKGYRYYLPVGFSIYSDEDYNQVLISKGIKYYLNIDIVSYYYKNEIPLEAGQNDYKYYRFGNNDKTGYLKIKKNNDYFFIELCYNYAIIEVEVEEKNINYAISRGISILNSIKYNDLVISKVIGNNEIDTSDTIYEIPSPENKDENKNILEYIEPSEIKDE